MLRGLLGLIGLASLVLGILLGAVPVAADDPPLVVTRQVVNQRVELLPQEPLCWSVNRNSVPAGGRRPPAGDHTHGMALGYVVEGVQRTEFTGGPSLVIGPREGSFVGNNNWHTHYSLGTSPVTEIAFVLTCDAPNPGVVRLAATGPLSGVRPGPYMVTLVEGSGVPGARQDAVGGRTTPGPSAWYVLEGEIAQSTPGGISRYRAGDVFLNPVGTPFENSVVGSSTARFLVVQLFPAGQVLTRLPDVRLATPSLGGSPTALPRTGEEIPLIGPLATVVGALLLATGAALWRAKT